MTPLSEAPTSALVATLDAPVMGYSPWSNLLNPDRSRPSVRACLAGLVVASLLCAGWASPTRAGETGKVELFFGGGPLSATGGFSRQSVSGPTGTEEAEAILEQGDGYLFSITFRAHRPVGFEVSYSHFTTKYLVDLYGYNPQDGSRNDHLTGEHTTSVGHFGFTVVVVPWRGPVIPYLAGGIGWMLFIDTAAFSPTGAVGLKFFPTRHVGLRAEGRIYSAHLSDDLHGTVGPHGPTYAYAEYSDDFTYKDLVVGLVLRF